MTDFLGFVFGALFPLLFLGGIIALIVVVVRRFSEPDRTESPGTSVRRFFQYALLLTAMIVAAVGLSELLAAALPDAGTVIAQSEPATRLARPLAFVIVGLPAFLLLWRFTRRQIEENPAERDSLGWAFYVTVAMVIALVIIMVSGIAVLRWILGVADYSPTALAFLLVWSAVWAGHWVFGYSQSEPSQMRLQLAAGSAAGLWTTAGAAAFALGVSLQALYDQLFSTVIVGSFSNVVRDALAVLIVGAVVWWWYWLRHYASSERTQLWNGYVLILGVLGGLIATIGALGTLLFSVLQWFLGNPSETTAAGHFELVPAAVATAAVGGVVWWYHRSVVQATAAHERQEVDRIYQYLVAGLGLVASASGIVVALVALIEALTGEVIAGSGGDEIDTLLGAVTALVIGLPLWWTSWASIQRHAAADPDGELDSPTRRIYLFLVFGVGGLIAVVSLIVTVSIVAEDIIGGTLGSGTLYDVRVPIALLITVGLIAWYHWTIYQADRATHPLEVPSPARQVTVVAPSGLDVAEIADATGARVRLLERRDDVTVDVDGVIAALEASEDDRVLVVTTDSGEVLVIPVASDS